MSGARSGPSGQPRELDDTTERAHGTDAAAEMGRRQVRGSAILMLGRIAALVLTTATQIIIVRALSKTDFGSFAYALALAAAGRTLLSLGQGKLLSRFMATYEEQRDYNRMFGAMFLAVVTIALTSILTITALFLFNDALVGSAVDSPTAIQLVLILVFLAPLEALDQVFVSLFAVFGKPSAIFFRKHLLTPGLRLLVVLLLVVLGSSVTFLAIGYVVSALIGLFIYLGLLVQMLRERDLLKELKPRQMVLPYKAVFAFSFPLITGELFLLSQTAGGVLLLAYYQSTVEVANYRAVFNPARLNTAITTAFVTLFLPMAARLFARDDVDGLRRSYWHTAVLVAVLTFPIFALTGPLAPNTTVLLFGARYAESSTVLAVLAIGYYFGAMLGFNAYTLQVCGRIRYLVGVNVFVAALNLGLSFVLIPHFAAAGAAVANCAALVTQNVLNQWALRRSIGTAFIDRAYLSCYLIIIGCSSALWAFQLLAAPGLIVSLTVATVISLVVLFTTRKALQLSDTFPELARLPVVRWLIR